MSREKEEARVEYDDGKISPQKLVSAIDRLGFQASLLEVTSAP